MFYIMLCGYCVVWVFFLFYCLVFLFCSELQRYNFIQSCGVRMRNHKNDASASLICHHGVIVLHCMTLPNFTMKIFKAVP